MSAKPKLKPFSFVVMILVGESGAGPHDIVRMMREGRWLWTGSESQFYAEPKRLEKLGYLKSDTEPGITRDRTVYQLTDEGRTALQEWLAEPSNLPRLQDEQIVRLLGSEFVDPETTLNSLRPLRARLEADLETLTVIDERADQFPHRTKVLRINFRLSRKVIEAHLEWLDEVEAALG